jgi:hypothetical protein
MAEWYHTPKVDLSEEQRTLSASLLWLLKGDAAQRVIAAWHFGWGPALEASGRGWQAPFLALTLRDPYGVVRYVAAASLAKLPGFSSFRFDFLAPSEGLARSSREAVALWSGQSKPPDRTGGEVLLNEDGTPQEAATLRLVQQRDNRPVRIKE